MFVVHLETAIPGVRNTTFVFYSDGEACEFQSCIAWRYPDVGTTLEPAGEPTEVFDNWSY